MDPTTEKPAVFQPKQSSANRLWILIIVVVLSTLFFEMHGNSRQNYNCCISAPSEVIGADVSIDNQKVGNIVKDEAAGLGGGVYRTMLLSGPHHIEVKKDNFKTFTRDVEMKKELYLEANLSRSAG